MRAVVLLLLFGAWATVGAIAQSPTIDGASRISQSEFKKLVETDAVVVVDTRNPEVYALGHIPGALLLPLEGLQDFPSEYAGVIQQLKASKKPIVTYCA